MALFSGIQEIFTDSAIADGAVTAYHAVKMSSDTEAKMTDTQGEKIDGIALESVSDGQTFKFMRLGIVPVIVKTASGISRGSNLTASAAGTSDDGKVEVAASGDYTFGRALTAPSADDDQIMAVVDCVKYEAAIA